MERAAALHINGRPCRISNGTGSCAAYQRAAMPHIERNGQLVCILNGTAAALHIEWNEWAAALHIEWNEWAAALHMKWNEWAAVLHIEWNE